MLSRFRYILTYVDECWQTSKFANQMRADQKASRTYTIYIANASSCCLERNLTVYLTSARVYEVKIVTTILPHSNFIVRIMHYL